MWALNRLLVGRAFAGGAAIKKHEACTSHSPLAQRPQLSCHHMQAQTPSHAPCLRASYTGNHSNCAHCLCPPHVTGPSCGCGCAVLAVAEVSASATTPHVIRFPPCPGKLTDKSIKLLASDPTKLPSLKRFFVTDQKTQYGCCVTDVRLHAWQHSRSAGGPPACTRDAPGC